jgi:hypothetical protein
MGVVQLGEGDAFIEGTSDLCKRKEWTVGCKKKKTVAIWESTAYLP